MVTQLSQIIDMQMVQARGTERVDVNSVHFADVSEDLAEFDYLLNDLIKRNAEVERESAVNVAFAEKLANLQKLYTRRIEMMQRPTTVSLLSNFRREYVSVKSLLRECFRDQGNLLCASDWQSPIYAASTEFKLNRLHTGIAEHKLDYKRDGHLEAISYEQNFVREYVAHLGGAAPTKAYLTNSGMAAYSTVLHWLAHEQHLGEATVAIEPMYFENIHLARGFFPQMVRLHAPSKQDLLEQLRLNDPSVVLLDAITNCNDVLAHDLEAVIKWAATERRDTTAIVVDSTCVPTALLPTDLLKDLPEHVTIIFVESLAKHHQFGMDAVTGGIVVMQSPQKMHESFGKTRARFGGNITDTSAASLPTPSREHLTARMRRHSRNVALLIDRIQEKIENYPGIIESFSWLSEPADFAPNFHGSCFVIHLHEDLRSIDKYQKFEEQVLAMAKQRNLNLALSTSFGFDVTRLYVTAPSTLFEPPFLRVSIGTETAEEIEELAEIISSVHRQLALVWKPRNAVKEKKPAQPASVAKIQSADGILHKHNVFVGENALKDYLSPANFMKTPMVELPKDLNPFAADGVHIFAKVVPLVPLMNIKSIPAFSMLQAAAERGELDAVKTVLESSSGNTVLSLSVVSKLFGIDETRAIVDHSIAPGLLRTLRLFGVDVMLHPGPGHELYASVKPRSEIATALGAQDGWMNPGQYNNPDNPEGFGKWLAPDIWSQTQGKISVFSGALGTCGTIYGVSRELKKRNRALQVVACCPKAGQAVPGPREHSQLADVSFPWQEMVDVELEMESKESFAASIKLLRRGIMGGPSSGMNYAGLLQYLAKEKTSGRLQSTVQALGGGMTAVFLCCDTPFAHVDEYFDALGDEHFSQILPIDFEKIKR